MSKKKIQADIASRHESSPPQVSTDASHDVGCMFVASREGSREREKMRLSTETIQSATLSLEGVDDI